MYKVTCSPAAATNLAQGLQRNPQPSNSYLRPGALKFFNVRSSMA
jgi:hypothetical protein